jgi:putative hydrolase of the HAD superfamily
MMIKHVSFDIWGTLLISNDKFKRYRSSYLYQEIKKNQDTHLSPLAIQLGLTDISQRFDKISERTGQAVSSDFMLGFALDEFKAPDLDVDFIQSMIEDIFLNDLPQINHGALNLLDSFREKGIQANILSNTGFISGKVMRKALGMLGLEKYFSFEIFSDEEGISKPNPKMFDKVFHKATVAACERGILIKERYEILHIGDSVVCDGAAAKSGLNFELYDRAWVTFPITNSLK